MFEEFDEQDEDEALAEMLTQAREHLFARDLLAVTSTEEQQQVLANCYTLIRSVADSLAMYAMVLGRIPTEEMAKGIAEHLQEMADNLHKNLPVKSDEDEDDE